VIIILPAAHAEKVWEEQDGLVIIEAENSEDRGSAWSLESSYADYSGSGYIRTNSSGGSSPATNYNNVSSSKKVTYNIKFNKIGMYLIKLDNYHHSKDGDNDVYVAAFGGAGGKNNNTAEVLELGHAYTLRVEKDHRFRKFYDSTPNTWNWCDGHSTFYQMPVSETGVIPISLSPRSSGFAVDKIAVIHGDVPYEVWVDRSEIKESPINIDDASDDTPPAAPTNVQVSDVTATNAQVTWNGVSDSDFWRYVVYVDGEPFAPSFKTGLKVTGLLDNTSHTISVKTKDMAGNVSTESNQATFSTPAFEDNVDGAIIKKTKTAPTMDGKGDDAVWDEATAYEIKRPICGRSLHIQCDPGDTPPISDENDCSGTFKALWDDQYIYYLIEVTDNVVENSRNYGNINKHHGMWDDGIELMMSDNVVRHPAYHAGRVRFRFMAGDNTVREIARYFSDENSSPHTDNVLLRRSNFTSGSGYTFEIRFPHKNLMQAPEHNKLAGLEIHIADVDAGNSKPKAFVAWHDTVMWFREDQAPDFGVAKYVDPDMVVGVKQESKSFFENITIQYAYNDNVLTLSGITDTKARVALFDCRGRKVFTSTVSEKNAAVRVPSLHPGTYLVRVDAKPRVFHRKFVVRN
jgi:hypothetical protein